MHQQDIGVTVAGQTQGLARADSHHPHRDAAFFGKFRQQLIEQPGILG